MSQMLVGLQGEIFRFSCQPNNHSLEMEYHIIMEPCNQYTFLVYQI